MLVVPSAIRADLSMRWQSHSFGVSPTLIYESNPLRCRQPSPNDRQAIGIQVLARTEPISHLVAKHEVSRKFVYQQGDKAQRSLNETSAPYFICR